MQAVVTIDNKYKWAVFIILIGVFIYFRWQFEPENFYPDMLELRKKDHYSGIVLKKYIDSANHNVPKLKLTSGTIPLENEFWDRISVGDSLVKIENDDIITIYRPNKTKRTCNYTNYINSLY